MECLMKHVLMKFIDVQFDSIKLINELQLYIIEIQLHFLQVGRVAVSQITTSNLKAITEPTMMILYNGKVFSS
jgi:hypothetical protein